jgi:hypothetical protein
LRSLKSSTSSLTAIQLVYRRSPEDPVCEGGDG